jgi:nucleoside-diphosphate-sugar epimerase
MLGRKLVAELARQGALGERKISGFTLADVVPAQSPEFGGSVRLLTADLSEPGIAESLLDSRPGLIFHGAAVVSGEAEADFEKGYRINLDATRALFDAIRRVGGGYRPRVVFTSSVAVFGDPLPNVIGDSQQPTPLSSYGTQKAIAELLLADYTRKGFFDGIGLRLPTIVIRPGKPNKAVSGFFSSILREPLIGQEAVLPVSDTIRHWFASPRAAVRFMLHAATLDSDALGSVRTLTMPGVSATVADQIAALRRVAGDAAVALIRRVPDPAIDAIIRGWPRSFDARRAVALGFRAEASFEEIIRIHIKDELGGMLPPQPRAS